MRNAIILLFILIGINTSIAQDFGVSFGAVHNTPTLEINGSTEGISLENQNSFLVGIHLGRLEIADHFYWNQKMYTSDMKIVGTINDTDFEFSGDGIKIIQSFVYDFIRFEKGSIYAGLGVGTGFTTDDAIEYEGEDKPEFNFFQGVSGYGTFGARYNWDDYVIFLEGDYEYGFTDILDGDRYSSNYSGIYFSIGVMTNL